MQGLYDEESIYVAKDSIRNSKEKNASETKPWGNAILFSLCMQQYTF